MKDFTATRSDGMQATITAARYEHDGSGVRFYDDEGGVVASFYDGVIKTVVPAGVTFGAPPSAPEAEGEA